MASIDDELLLDAQEDAREAEYIFNQLSSAEGTAARC